VKEPELNDWPEGPEHFKRFYFVERLGRYGPGREPVLEDEDGRVYMASHQVRVTVNGESQPAFEANVPEGWAVIRDRQGAGVATLHGDVKIYGRAVVPLAPLEGWQCPKCRRIWGPQIAECRGCHVEPAE
jgi:hypothetical protein